MAGSTEDRFDALEARRGKQALLIQNEGRCNQDTTEAERVRREIEDELAALRVRTTTFASTRDIRERWAHLAQGCHAPTPPNSEGPLAPSFLPPERTNSLTPRRRAAEDGGSRERTR
ncbi:hypothetical protein DK389_14935 [Methylobacterium durans]|uniref:Uncharacterized protein n=1 Tax=Methylobacterium durans TaxID=2202825 RepID=A0A2U8W684_9HYPH|nr:hypothetical protein DK389_14935 [Methylobacterium durans]